MQVNIKKTLGRQKLNHWYSKTILRNKEITARLGVTRQGFDLWLKGIRTPSEPYLRKLESLTSIKKNDWLKNV